MVSLVLIGLLAIFTYSADHVSAANSSTVYVSKLGSDNWNGLYSTYTNGTNGPKATIKSAVGTVATGGTVNIANGTYNENQISINKNMNLAGAGQQNTIINGNNAGRLFNIASTASVTMSNLTLANGYSSTAGAIDNQGTLTIKSCTLKNNTATVSGGAISNHFKALTITDSTFTSNKATNFGGAIESQGLLTITGSTFTGNTVPGKDGDGGAIDSKGGIYIENSTFSNNTVTPDVPTSEGVLAYGDCGGAIYNFNSPSSVSTFKKVTFLNNNAPYGGAFDNYQGTLNVIDCTFKGNNACVNGGAIEIEGTGVVNISGTTIFSDNTATWAADIFNCHSCTVTGVSFTNSKATTAGGSLNNQGTFNITNCTFTNTSAGNDGGAIENHGIFNITGCSFNTSKATFDGGFIDNQGTMTIKSSSFSGGTVTNSQGDGGAIDTKGNLTITNGCSFTNNSAHYGGAIYNGGSCTIDSSTTFSGNSATNGSNTYPTNLVPQPPQTSLNVTGITPSNNSTNVSTASKTVTLTFNNSLQSGSAYSSIYILNTASNTKQTITKSISGSTLTLTVAANWAPGTTYNVYIPVNAVKDTNGNSLSTAYSSKFTTAASGVTPTPITVKSITPASNATNVSVSGTNPKITITFSCPIQSGSAYSGIYLRNTITGTNKAITTAMSGSTLTLTAVYDWQLNTPYIVYIPVNAVKDANGNTLSTNYSSTFTTMKAVEGTTPTNPVTTDVTLNQLISASNNVKSYFETNHVLPSSVTVGSQTIGMPQLLQLLVKSTSNLNSGNLNAIPVVAVNPAPNPSGSFTAGNIQKSEYLTMATYIQNFISTNGRAPNYNTTSLGNIPFSKLVYMYSKLIAYYGTQNRLPNYISIS